MSLDSHEPLLWNNAPATPPEDSAEWWDRVNSTTPVAQVPETTNTAADPEIGQPAHTEPVLEKTPELEPIASPGPERGRRWTPKKIVAAVGAVVLVAGGAITAIAMSGGGKKHPGGSQSAPKIPGQQPISEVTPTPQESAIGSGPISVSDKLQSKYPPIIPPTTTDQGDAAFQLLADIRRYEITGNNAYLDAAVRGNETPQTTIDDIRNQEQQWQAGLAGLNATDRQKEVDTAFKNFYFQSAEDLGDNGVQYSLNVTTDEFNPQSLTQNKSGNTTVIRHINISKTHDANGNEIFYVRNQGVVTSTPDTN